jgi:hypothetical protein
MGWQELLREKDEASFAATWLGGRVVRVGDRAWRIEGPLPAEHGWYRFESFGRHVVIVGEAEPRHDLFSSVRCGFLAGDRLVADDTPSRFERVLLVEAGLERFTRISAGRIDSAGPLVYRSRLFPLGPEADVQRAFEDHVRDLAGIPGVTPALEGAFRIECQRRDEVEARRRAAEEKRSQEARRRALLETLGDGEGRRALARCDFGEAAKSALLVGGAAYVDHRRSGRRAEWVVRFRMLDRRFECTCDEDLRIIDSGICLIDHETGEKGDGRFTLESLPAVIREADRDGRLVVFRHVE